MRPPRTYSLTRFTSVTWTSPPPLPPAPRSRRTRRIVTGCHLPGKMVETHKKHPDTYILGTEACEGFLPWSQGPYLGDWKRAETYAHDILGDLNSFAVGWTDWNAFLDLKGGPNWVSLGELCSPLTTSASTLSHTLSHTHAHTHIRTRTNGRAHAHSHALKCTTGRKRCRRPDPVGRRRRQ